MTRHMTGTREWLAARHGAPELRPPWAPGTIRLDVRGPVPRPSPHQGGDARLILIERVGRLGLIVHCRPAVAASFRRFSPPLLRIVKDVVIAGEAALVPAFIAVAVGTFWAWCDARRLFVDFFTAHIRNRNTRAAYAVAVRTFSAWCDARRLTLGTLRAHNVAAYVELLGKRYTRPRSSSTWPPSACSSTGYRFFGGSNSSRVAAAGPERVTNTWADFPSWLDFMVTTLPSARQQNFASVGLANQ
jgi:hypothetical protein